jgi:hypothetical protein
LIAAGRAAGYPWFVVHALLEKSTSRFTAGDLAEAEALSREALLLAERHKLPVARLRAGGFVGSRLVIAGRYREAAELHSSLLQLFWSRPFPYMRAQQFYNDAATAEEALGRVHAAQASVAMSARMAELAGATVTRAVALARRGGLEECAGMRPEALRHWELARTILAGVSRNETSEEYRAFAEAQVAEAAVDRATLSSLESVLRTSDNPMVVVPYLVALASVEKREGRLDRSETLLARSVDHLLRNTGRFSAGERRNRWRNELNVVYRALVEARLARGNEDGAWRSWQDFLRADSAILGARSRRLVAATGPPAGVLTYVRLGDRYAAWFRYGTQSSFRWLYPEAHAIDRLARRHLAFTNAAEVDESFQRSAGRELAEVLFHGILPVELPASLIIQPDAELARVCWNGLPAGVGEEYLSERLDLAITLLPVNDSPRIPARRPGGKALVAGATVIDPSRTPDYRPLPGIADEIAAVQSAFQAAMVLQAGDATVSRLEPALRGVSVLHFAGHAAGLPYDMRLLVAPDADHPDGMWRPNVGGTGLELVVLSACSTGRYEESDSADPRHLAHSFLLGGAEQVVASQWNVDSEATAGFMRFFYEHLRRGGSVAAALRGAAKDVRSNPAWRHPYFWSSFALFV